ncbi:hypothetical protein EN871_28885 [bacterium M00.F.Ca.ET.228.01.1.1]|nr:hypothetical protein EN871_28885 [bacterium M00.F.Ca.ET.228.01.1.1]TGR96473.1 hypothetical protein EN834_27935 [bacterium M00.F.Ca.ET.191.01.1.1]TGT97709.1 hypothetical protein EN798_27940 [bacterium M00.F.Ca.ET.155.01.1.1]
MFNHFIQTFIDAQTAAWRHYSAIAATEKRLFGEGPDPAVRVPTTAQVVDELRRTYETLATRIIWKAREQFACEGKRPLVHRAAILKAAGFDAERSLALGEVPDFDLLWTVLEAQLGNIGAPAGER